MKKDSKQLIDKIDKKISKIQLNNKLINEYADLIVERYNQPIIKALDYLQGNYKLTDTDRALLYQFTDVLFGDDVVEEYFTDIEKKEYSKKFKNKKFDKTFSVIKVTDSQYIGTITAKELMQMRDDQIIAYNPNTQRKMRLKNGVYRIVVSKLAVKSIIHAFLNKEFFPNTITLNCSADADFIYDEELKTLHISNTDKFDILDGYHRYVALSTININNDPDFDYPMELRITRFSEDAANRFIFQEDKKTKMTVTESRSLDQNAEENKIVKMLLLESQIGKLIGNNGIINESILSYAIFNVYNKEIKEKTMRIAEIEKRIYNKLLISFINNPEIFNKILSKNEIYAFILSSKIEKDYNDILNFIVDNDLFKNSRLNKKDCIAVMERM